MSESHGGRNRCESSVKGRVEQYDVVPYRPGFRHALFELQKHLWSPDHEWNAAYFHWKYESNPYLREPLVYLVFEGQQPVGMRGAWGAEWEIGPDGQRCLAPAAGDLVVAPPHRGRGLFRKIMDATQTDLRRRDFVFLPSLSAGETTYLLSLRAGWQFIGPWQMFCRFSKEKDDRRPGQLGPVDLRGSEVFREFDLKAETAKTVSGRPLRVESNPRPRDMAALIRKIPWDGRIRHVRDQRFFWPKFDEFTPKTGQ